MTYVYLMKNQKPINSEIISSHVEYLKKLNIGYFEKGYKGKVIVDINSADKDGKLLIKVKDSTGF